MRSSGPIEGNDRIVYQVFTDYVVILTVFEGHQPLKGDKLEDST